MERDRDSLDFELMGENHFAAIDARQEAEQDDEQEEKREDWYARYCRRELDQTEAA